MVTLSSAEAECVALSAAMMEVTALHNFLSECNVCSIQDPAIMYEDNQAVIKMATSHWTTPRSRHIGIKCHHVRELLRSSQCDIRYVRTSEQLADSMTKAVTLATLQKLLRFLFGL